MLAVFICVPIFLYLLIATCLFPFVGNRIVDGCYNCSKEKYCLDLHETTAFFVCLCWPFLLIPHLMMYGVNVSMPVLNGHQRKLNKIERKIELANKEQELIRAKEGAAGL